MREILNGQSVSKAEKRTHANNRTMRKRPRYSTQQKIRAVSAMLACDTEHPLSYEAQAAAQAILGAPVSVYALRQWLNEYRTTIETQDKSLVPKPLDIPELISSTREQVIKNLNSAVKKMSSRINSDDVLNNAALRDLSVSMGISIEKILLLAGRIPELDAAVTTLQAECQGTEYNPVDLIDDVIAAVREAKNKRKPTIDLQADN